MNYKKKYFLSIAAGQSILEYTLLAAVVVAALLAALGFIKDKMQYLVAEKAANMTMKSAIGNYANNFCSLWQ